MLPRFASYAFCIVQSSLFCSCLTLSASLACASTTAAYRLVPAFHPFKTSPSLSLFSIWGSSFPVCQIDQYIILSIFHSSPWFLLCYSWVPQQCSFSVLFPPAYFLFTSHGFQFAARVEPWTQCNFASIFLTCRFQFWASDCGPWSRRRWIQPSRALLPGFLSWPEW